MHFFYVIHVLAVNGVSPGQGPGPVEVSDFFCMADGKPCLFTIENLTKITIFKMMPL